MKYALIGILMATGFAGCRSTQAGSSSELAARARVILVEIRRSGDGWPKTNAKDCDIRGNGEVEIKPFEGGRREKNIAGAGLQEVQAILTEMAAVKVVDEAKPVPREGDSLELNVKRDTSLGRDRVFALQVVGGQQKLVTYYNAQSASPAVDKLVAKAAEICDSP